jgi:hypothetical protein
MHWHLFLSVVNLYKQSEISVWPYSNLCKLRRARVIQYIYILQVLFVNLTYLWFRTEFEHRPPDFVAVSLCLTRCNSSSFE